MAGAETLTSGVVGPGSAGCSENDCLVLFNGEVRRFSGFPREMLCTPSVTSSLLTELGRVVFV